MDKDFQNTRYSSLVEIWSHHNTMQLQWPSLAITTVLIILSILLPSQLETLTKAHLWGRERQLIFGAGLPLTLLGIGIAAMLYLMGRAKRVMIQIEKEISSIESQFGIIDTCFQKLNHPKGVSGIRVVRMYLIWLVATPITLLGFLMMLGFLWGSIVSVVFLGITIILKHKQN